MQQLPKNLSLTDTQDKWAAIINPMLANPALNSIILRNVPLKVGANTINHLLGRPLQGWGIIRMRGVFSQIYDLQDKNPMPQLTLALIASVAVSIDLEVF